MVYGPDNPYAHGAMPAKLPSSPRGAQDSRERDETVSWDLPLNEEDRGQSYRDPFPMWLYRFYVGLLVAVFVSGVYIAGLTIQESMFAQR
jgi:hypothetical protein